MGIIKMRTGKILILILFLLPALSAAQEDSVKTDNSDLPVLNNHYFVPSLGFLSPFFTTNFKTGIGNGISLSEIPVTVLDSTLSGTIRAEDVFVLGSIDVQIKVKDWMTVWLRSGMSARIGTTTPTILTHGFATGSDFEFGWLLRLFHNKKNLLSTAISINNTTLSSSNILRYALEVIESPDSMDVSLSKTRNPLSGIAGLRYAYAYNDIWGIQAFLNFLYGEAILKGSQNALKFDTGLLLSFEFSRYRVPFGLNLGYYISRFDLFKNKEDDQTEAVFLEIVYVHDRQFTMGLNFSRIRDGAPLLERVNSLTFINTSFVINYYF